MKYFNYSALLSSINQLVISARYQRLILTSSLLFLVLLNQNIIRTIKNSLVVTLIEPEIISFIKLYVEVPITFIVLVIYIKIYSLFSSKQIFNFTLIAFAIIFAIFGFMLLPNLELYSLDKNLVDNIIYEYPHLKWIMQLVEHWALVLLYVFGELWTAILYSLLLWELINRVTSVEDSKKDYPIINFFGQISTVLSGLLIVYLFNNISVNEFDQTLHSINSIQFLFSIVIISIISMFIIHAVLNKFGDSKNYNKKSNAVLDNAKTSIIENLRFILSSKYVFLISINVMCYSIAIMILEGLWFAKSRELYPSAESFINYQSQVLVFIGLSTLFFSILSNYLSSKVAWLLMALITPYSFISFGTIFTFACFIENKIIIDYALLPIIIFLGSTAHVLGKGTKYAFFDITKEMCYVPLDNALKAKSKAVIDVFCFHVGKMFGALLPLIIFSIFPSYTYNDITTCLLFLFIIVCVVWIVTIRKLSDSYKIKIIATSQER
jgi:ATP/ADP translocase